MGCQRPDAVLKLARPDEILWGGVWATQRTHQRTIVLQNKLNATLASACFLCARDQRYRRLLLPTSPSSPPAQWSCSSREGGNPRSNPQSAARSARERPRRLTCRSQQVVFIEEGEGRRHGGSHEDGGGGGDHEGLVRDIGREGLGHIRGERRSERLVDRRQRCGGRTATTAAPASKQLPPEGGLRDMSTAGSASCV